MLSFKKDNISASVRICGIVSEYQLLGGSYFSLGNVF